MNRPTRPFLTVLAVAGFWLCFASADARAAGEHAAEAQAVPLWSELSPAGAPGDETVQDRGTPDRPNRFVSDITFPTYAVYLPPKEKASGAAVVVCPGGGYAGVAIDKEGHEVARRLNSFGVAAVVLKYRMPRPAVTKAGPPLPLLDVQRTIRLVRSRAEEWNLRSDRVGVMGFSAGGHLASMAATRFTSAAATAPTTATGAPATGAATEVAAAARSGTSTASETSAQADAPDAFASLPDRPDFVILVYPVITFQDEIAHGGSRKRLLGDAPTPELIESFSSEKRVTPRTPPTFLVHAADDRVKCENSLLFRAALAKAEVPAELHLFDRGGHGFGLGDGASSVSQWPVLCARWLADGGKLRPTD